MPQGLDFSGAQRLVWPLHLQRPAVVVTGSSRPIADLRPSDYKSIRLTGQDVAVGTTKLPSYLPRDIAKSIDKHLVLATAMLRYCL